MNYLQDWRYPVQGIPLQVPPGEEKMFRAAEVQIFLVINRSEVFSCMEGGEYSNMLFSAQGLGILISFSQKKDS